MTNEELYHHGVLGMKWGEHRFQNRHGAITSEGERQFHKVFNSNSRFERDTRDALKIYNKERVHSQRKANMYGRKIEKTNLKLEKSRNSYDENKIKKYEAKVDKYSLEAKNYINRSNIATKKFKDVSSGEKLAGRDFIVQRDYNLYPLVIPVGGITLVGAYLGTKKQVIER